VIRSTYKGREVKILAARRPGQYRVQVNGHQIHNGIESTEIGALDWLRSLIDRIDQRGPGNNPYETSPFWYEPGTYRLNKRGHVVALNGTGCVCDLCLTYPENNIPADVETTA
jgi:hypothetical protein